MQACSGCARRICESATLHHEFSARQFCFSRRFQDELLERQYREAKFKLGRPRLTALIVVLLLIELEVLISAAHTGTGLRVVWLSVIAPFVLLWLLLAIIYSPWMSRSRLPVLAYSGVAAYEGFALYGQLAAAYEGSTQALNVNETHNASWVVGSWYIAGVLMAIWSDSSGLSPAASFSLYSVVMVPHVTLMHTAYERQPASCAALSRDFSPLWVHLCIAFGINAFLVVLVSTASRRGYVVSAMLASRRDEQLVIEKHKDREQMMALTFHEVRNPLNGTVGHLHLARHSLSSTAAETAGGTAEALSEVDASLACTEIAMQFLTTLSSLHSAVTAGMVTQLQPCDLSRILVTVATVVRPQLQPGVALRLDVPTEPKLVVTDPIMLKQILINLLQNAARFTQTGYVCLQCFEGDPPHGGARQMDKSGKQRKVVDVASDVAAPVRMTFTVKDTGTGLDAEVYDTLFELYKTQGGLGLGLYLSRQLIRLLGSEVHVESPWAEDGSSGTAFSFSVNMAACTADESLTYQPAAETAPAAAPVKEPPQAASLEPVFAPHLRVLVADDQQTNRRLLERAFTKFFGEGWSVAEASTAEQALELSGESDFDIVIMDEIFSMEAGVLRGSEAIKRLRRQACDAEAAGRSRKRRPVIIHCTGQTTHDAAVDQKALLDSGADALWGKPMPCFTNGEMQRMVADLLAGGAARDALP